MSYNGALLLESKSAELQRKFKKEREN